MNKPKISKEVLITGLICLTVLEGWALYNGINGALFSLVIAAIAGICGWSAPQLKTK